MASSLSAFLGEIGRHQLLTPEQELTLGRKVQAMVARLLGLPGEPGKDAADALGIAIMDAHARVSFDAMSRQTTLQRRQHAQFKGSRTY